jgi:hypothetical protein
VTVLSGSMTRGRSVLRRRGSLADPSSAQELVDHGMAECEPLGRKDFLDIIDRIILLTQLNHAFAGSVSFRGTLGSGLLGKEEGEAAEAEITTEGIEGR